MKKSVFLKAIALILTAATLALTVASLGAAAEDEPCFHTTEKSLVKTDSGYTIANVCTACGSVISDIGYVDASKKITLSNSEGVAYSADALKNGFAGADGTLLYTANEVLSTKGVPYWLTFDLDVVSIPTLKEGAAEADLSATGKRAYKGWSIICIINNSYDTVLRLIPDGWEEGSGAAGSTKGKTDGISPIKYNADSEGFRFAESVAEVKAGDKLGFAIRLEPASGKYDVYVDGVYAGSGKTATRSEDKNPAIRLWEGDGKNNGGVFNYTNIAMFADNYTEAVHKHVYTEIIDFDDVGVSRYSLCDCGDKKITANEQISSLVLAKGSDIYNGYNRFSINDSGYWFVTDFNVRDTIGNGAVLSILAKGETQVLLSVEGGKLKTANSTVAKIKYPTTYQIAAYITHSNYQLYLDGRKVAEGEMDVKQKGKTIVLGNEGFGHHVRFLYNKAVKLGETETPVVPEYIKDASIKLCSHDDGGATKAETRSVKHYDGVVTYTYNCVKCGERVYAKITNSLASVNNDELFSHKPKALKASEIGGFTANAAKVLYLENGVIGKTASPYWITFDLTPVSLPTLEGLDVNDPNGAAQRGYNVVSAEASFYPVSQLRAVPTADGAELRILTSNVGSNVSHYRAAVASLEVGKAVSVAIYLNPANGNYDVYIDGIYKGSATTAALKDFNPQIMFHDNGGFEFTYSNVLVAKEARSVAKSINSIEFKAVYQADKTKPEGYTPVASIKRNTDKDSYLYTLVYVNNRTGELCILKNGTYSVLTTGAGEAYKLSAEPTEIAAVYDDTRATVRYYVNGKVPYINGSFAINLAVDADFAGAESVADLLITDLSIVSNATTKGLEASGTMQIVGLQQKIVDNALRIVSGLDVPWYGSAGYRVTLFDANGNKVSEEKTCKTSTMYSEIVADGVVVPASLYGYSYFVPLEISGFTASEEYAGYHLLVTPFTTVGGQVLDGTQVRINITASGYEFAE